MKKLLLCGALAFGLSLGIAGCAEPVNPTPPVEDPNDEQTPVTDTVAPIVTVSLSKGIVNQKLAFAYSATDDVTADSDLQTTVALTKDDEAVEYDADNSFYATEAGEYTVTVTAKDEAGNVGSGEAQVTVDEAGSFTIGGGIDAGVTISEDGKALIVSDAYVDGNEIIPTSEYEVDGLQMTGSFQLDFNVSGLTYDVDNAEATVYPKLFVNLHNEGSGTDSIWLEPRDAIFGVYNVTSEEAWKNGVGNGFTPLPEGTEEKTVSIVRLAKESAVWYGIAYNDVLVDVFMKGTDASDLIDLVTFNVESMAITVSDVKLTDFAINEETAVLEALEDYVWEMENTEFDRVNVMNADFSKEFDTAPEITLDQGAFSYAYFKNTVGKYYLFEATFENERSNQGGLIYASHGNTKYALFTDGKNGSGSDYTSAKVWMSLVINGTTISWPFQNKGSYELKKDYDATQQNKITVVRDDDTFYYFVNDEYLGRRVIESLAGKDVQIGFGNNVDITHYTEWTVQEVDTSAGLDALHAEFAEIRAEYESSVFDRDNSKATDFSGEFNQTPEVIVQNGRAYFKETAGLYYAFSAVIESAGNQMGLFYATHDNVMYALATDAGNGGNRNAATVMMSLAINGSTVIWPYQNGGSVEYYFAPDDAYNASQALTITIVRENTYFYYFLNGKYLGMREHPEVDGLEVKVGLWANTTATYSEWSIEETEEADDLELLVPGLEAARESSFERTRQTVVQDGSDLVITTEQNVIGYAFFKGTYGTSYHLQTTFTKAKNNNAGGGRAGVIFAHLESTDTKYAIVTDSSASPAVTVMLLKISGHAVSWPFENKGSFEMFTLYNGAGEIGLDIIRDNTKFYILIDGNCVAMWELPQVDELDTKVALVSHNNTVARFSEYSITEENVTVPTTFKLNSVFGTNNKAGDVQYSYYGYQKAGLYYEFSADVQVTENGSGQAGLLYALDGESGANSTTARYSFQLDAGNGTDTRRAIMGIRTINRANVFPGNCNAATFEDHIAYARTGVVKMKIIRDNDKFYLYANDQYINTVHLKSLKDKPTYVGFTTRNETITFSNVMLIEHTTPVDCSADFIKSSYTVEENTGLTVTPENADVNLISTGTVTVSAKMSNFTMKTGSYKIAIDFIVAKSDNTLYSDRLGLDISLNSGVFCINGEWSTSEAFGTTLFDTVELPESVTLKVKRQIIESKAVYTLWINGQEISFTSKAPESAFVGPVKGIKFAVENVSMTVSDVEIELG